MMKDDVKFHIKFIKTVQSYPCLYDFNDNDYNSKTTVRNTWNTIGNLFGESGITCKTKWRTLRSSYIRWKTAKKSEGSCPKKEYYLAPYLRFLDQYIRTSHNSTTDTDDVPIEFCSYEENMDMTDQADEQMIDNVEPENQSLTEVRIKRRISTESESYPEPNKKLQKDPNELFLLSLAPHLNSMNERQLLNFQKGVVELIEKIKYP